MGLSKLMTSHLPRCRRNVLNVEDQLKISMNSHQFTSVIYTDEIFIGGDIDGNRPLNDKHRIVDILASPETR